MRNQEGTLPRAGAAFESKAKPQRATVGKECAGVIRPTDEPDGQRREERRAAHRDPRIRTVRLSPATLPDKRGEERSVGRQIGTSFEHAAFDPLSVLETIDTHVPEAQSRPISRAAAEHHTDRSVPSQIHEEAAGGAVHAR